MFGLTGVGVRCGKIVGLRSANPTYLTPRGELGKKGQFVPPLCKGRVGGVESHTQRAPVPIPTGGPSTATPA